MGVDSNCEDHQTVISSALLGKICLSKQYLIYLQMLRAASEDQEEECGTRLAEKTSFCGVCFEFMKVIID